MSELPANWKTSALGEIADTQLGKMLNKSKQTGKSTVSYLRSLNVQWGRIDIDDLNAMDIELNERDKFTVKKGDLLVCEGGESGRAAIWQGDEPIGFQNALHRIRPAVGIETRYLFYYFEWLVKNRLIDHLFNGVTIKHFPQENLRSVKISYPPLAEQRQIVEILEGHLSRLDAVLADVKQAKVKAAQFRRSLLQVALNGKFSDNKINLVTKLPNDWKWLTLKDVARWGSGGTPKSSDKSLYGGKIPWIVIGDLTEGLVNKTAQSINQKGLDSSSAKLMPPGTVMVAMYGASIGRTGVMAKAMTTNQAIACGIVNESIMTKEYLLYYLQSQKQDFIRAGKGGAQPNISQGVVKDWNIPVPPFDEQTKIILRLEEQLSHWEHSSKATVEIELSAMSFRRSLLQAAFTGQLTREVTHV